MCISGQLGFWFLQAHHHHSRAAHGVSEGVKREVTDTFAARAATKAPSTRDT